MNRVRTMYLIVGGSICVCWGAPLSAQAIGPQTAEQMMDPDGAPLSDEVMADLPAMPDAMTMDGPGGAMATDIVVTGARIRPRFVASTSGAVLSGDALLLQARATLGDTLAHLPGVSTTSFGPGVSRPVLRGFQGERTRLLVDGIQSLDVSNTSPDHAVAISPLIADRIEILRGPQALLYASGAVGGVVNTRIARLPRTSPRDGYAAVASAGFGTAADEATFGGRIDVAAGRFVLHADGHYLNASTLDIGGPVLAGPLRAVAAQSPDASVRSLATLSGRLPNSSAETFDIGGGVSLLTDRGELGLSISYVDSVYGLPTRYSLDPATPIADTLIDLGQLRADVRAELDIGNRWVETLRFRAGWADYSHDELLRDGTVQSTFSNDAFEVRAEAVGRRRGIWRTTSGLQYSYRDFRVIGAAPLLPASETEQFAMFSHHEFDLRPLRIDLGTRSERTSIDSKADIILQNTPIRRSFTSYSASLGASYQIANNWTLATNGFYSERAPVVEELLTQGTDPGTQGVLLGNAGLGEERAWGFEALVRAFGPRWSVEASAYYTRFPDYIFAAQTGDVVNGLPVFQFTGASASYYGFEAQAKVDVATIGAWTIGVDALADYTRASLTDGDGDVPRIPPLRLLGGVAARGATIEMRGEVEWTARQSRISRFETTTAAFLIANASLQWRPGGDGTGVLLSLSANNIFDAVGRRHASFLKDYAPVAGRDIRVTARWAF